MSVASICQWLEKSDVGTSIRESTVLFPGIETLHVLGLTMSVGLILISDLRLMGVLLKKRAASEVWAQILPWMATGFALMFTSGIFLFWSQAFKAYNSVFFRTKLVLLLLTVVNAAVYHLTIYRRMNEWDNAPVPPLQVRLTGLASIIIWAGVIVAGRTMAYTF